MQARIATLTKIEFKMTCRKMRLHNPLTRRRRTDSRAYYEPVRVSQSGSDPSVGNEHELRLRRVQARA